MSDNELQAKVSELEARLNALTIGKLDNASETLSRTSFVSPADGSPNDPLDPAFTGVAMGGNGWTFNGIVWHWVAVALGVLQVGINYAGQLLAGAGKVILDVNGITLESVFTSSLVDAVKIKWGTLAAIYASLSGPGGISNVTLESTGVSGGTITLVASNGVFQNGSPISGILSGAPDSALTTGATRLVSLTRHSPRRYARMGSTS